MVTLSYPLNAHDIVEWQ